MPRDVGTHTDTLSFDSLVIATGRIPNNSLYRELRARKDEWADNDIGGIYQVGDCFAPRLLADAIFDGHRIAREFESKNPQYAQPWIRERQIWGQETFPKLSDRETQG
jgi:dimethylamine/trimethylamine dehydrogenase